VLPVAAPKGYDRQEAAPIVVGSGTRAFQPGRFFIWNTATPYLHLSVEALADGSSRPADVAASWVSTAPIIGEAAYVKTHCHSLSPKSWDKTDNVVPTTLGQNFAHVFDALETRGVPVEHATVSEVMAQLRAADRA
jgi:hypothetical protein